MPGRSFLAWPQGGPFNPTVVPNPLPNAEVTASYSFQFSATSGTPGYTWVASGLFGTGFSLSSNGLLTGSANTPTTIPFTVTVTDANGAQSTANESLTVIPGPSITTTSLPNASVGTPYSFPMAATGGTPPYTWAITADTPDTGAWLSINTSTGVLSGTPGTGETEHLTIVVTDSLNVASTAANFTLTVVSNTGNAPYQMWPSITDTSTISFMWWVPLGQTGWTSSSPPPGGGAIPDYYNVYRDGIKIPMTTAGPPVLTNPGVTASPVEAPNKPMSWFTDSGLAPGVTHTYTVTAQYGATESAPGPALTMSTLTAGTTAMPAAPINPATYWTPQQIPNVAPVICNTAADFANALAGANINGPNLIVLTANAQFHIQTVAGWVLPAFTGTGGLTAIISSELPEYKVGGKLPAYNPSVQNVVPLVLTCTAPIPTNVTSATLTTPWPNKSGWYFVIFTEPTLVQSNGSLHEERLCVFTQGSATFSWTLHNNQYTAQTLTAQANAQIQVVYLTGVTPWDWNDNGAMPTLDIGSTVGGNGIQIPSACKKVWLAGLNVHTGPLLTNGAVGLIRFTNAQVNEANPFGDPTVIPSDSIYIDRCLVGSQAGDADFGYIPHGIGWINTNHLVINQCYIHGIISFPSGPGGLGGGGDSNNFGCNGGPQYWRNNYISAGSEGVIFGGIGVTKANPTSDVLFEGNVNHKPLSWWVGAVDGTSNGGTNPYLGFGSQVKNHFEAKVGFRLEYRNNLCLNNCTANQGSYHGTPFAMGARTPQGIQVDRDGGCPWMQITDVNIHDNIAYRIGSPFVSFTGEQTPTSLDARIRCYNNLFYVSPPLTQNERTNGVFIYGPCSDHSVQHNTILVNQSMNTGTQGVPKGMYWPPPAGINSASYLYIGAPSTPGNWNNYQDRLTVADNIIDCGGNNWCFSVQTPTNPWVFPNVTFNKNVTIHDNATYPGTGSYINVAYSALGMTNPPTATNQTIPLAPSDWNVVTGNLATGSTTGGPVGSIFGNVVVTTASLPNAVVGSAYSTTLTASGGSGSYAWNLESAAPNRHLWLGITRAGALFGVPQCDNVGQSNVPDTITVRVTDTATGNSGTATLSLNITNSGTLAINTPTTLPTAVNAGAYFYQLTAAGGSTPYLFWKITGHTGSNSWFISNNGWLWGVPTTNSTDTLTVTVTDVTGVTSAPVTLSITTNNSIQLAGVDRINNVINLPDARAGHKYRHQIRPANGGTGAGQTFSIVSGSLPAGLSMTAAGLITGTPTQSGNASCSLQCVDNGPNTSAAVPIALNVAAQSKGTKPAANSASGFFVDTTGQFCDPNGFRFMMRGMNRAHFDQQSTAYSNGGCSAVRYELYAGIFRGTNPGGGAQAFSVYVTDCNAQHTALGQYAILALFYLPGTLTQINTNPTTGNAASTIGTAAAYWCDNVATYNATLQNKAGINPANEWGMTNANFPLCYSAAWSKGVGTGVWQMPVASVNTSTGVITLAASVNDATNPLASCAQIGYVYFAGGGVSKAIAISTTGGSSGAWTVTASTLSDVAGWTSGGTVSGGVIGMLRAAGYTDPIHIDAGAQFGQIKTTFMQNGPTIAGSDPLNNIVLAYHAYGQTVNYGARVSSVTTGANATIHLNSTAGNHPLQPTSLSSNPITKVWVTGVTGMNGANGNLTTTGSGIGGSSGSWIVPTTATTTGTYASGGFVIPGFDSTNTFNYGHIDVLTANIATLAASGVCVMMEEFGPEAPSGDSPTIMGFQEVVQACEANGIPWAYWAGDDNRPVGTSDGNPNQFFYGVNGTNSASGVYVNPGDLISSGIDVVLNPRYGIHTLAQPASSYL